MFIDYVYLILILSLILVIVFLIYLSYEYRQPMTNIESFVTPIINNIPASENPKIDSNLYSFINNYDNLLIKGINNQLLIDENNMETILDHTIQNTKDAKKLLGIEIKELSDNNQFPSNKLIKTIKSNYNSQFISVHPQDSSNYGISVNDKCLTVKGLCDTDYCLQNCQNSLYTTDSQKFSTTRINNAIDAAKFMSKYNGKAISPDKINNKNIYPFNVFTSAINNNCLAINNDGLYVEPCNLNSIYHQWQISPTENKCVLR